MTPKEKAEELYWKYRTLNDDSYLKKADVYEKAKQCALIAVNEILNINPFSFNDKIHLDKIKEYQNYWQEVKQEIENL